MSTITIQDIRRDPDGFCKRVEAGESFVVVAGERTVAEVRAVGKQRTKPRPEGLAAGEIWIADDFDAPLPEEILKEFEGS